MEPLDKTAENYHQRVKRVVFMKRMALISRIIIIMKEQKCIKSWQQMPHLTFK